MSATLGGQWGLEQPSSERMNAKSLFVGTGDEIAAIPITSPIAFALCTADGSGFLANHLYHRHYDDVLVGWSGWDDVFRKHTHADDTETEGGDYYDIDITNAATKLSIFRHWAFPENFIVDLNGAGANVLEQNASGSIYTRLRTGTTANNWAALYDGGIKSSWSSKLEWHVTFRESSSAAAILWRMGVGMEKVGESSETTLQKIGIEGCDGDGTTIQLVACNGADRIKTNTARAMNQATAIGVKVTYIPSTSVTYVDSAGITKAATGGWPSSGPNQPDKLLRYGIKTTNTTEKFLDIWSDALYGKILDTAWI